MSKILPTIQEIQNELNALSETKTLAQAQRVILSVIRLLDDSVSIDDNKQFQLFNVDNQKISANAQWFYEDDVIVDRRAIYKIHSENKLNIDFKLYGITKPSKRTISWVQALTPNFEDEPFNSKFNIGIDFVVPKSVDKVIIVLSNGYVVRILELKGTLTATFQEILSKWANISDFSNKKEVHSILWESFDLQPLNKKFYAGISERFITLRQHLTKENILDDKHASLFSNRLLGRVIFCWFLDKKGVINPDRKYFDSHSFTNDSEYYRKNLENLFFGVLNTPIDEREYKDDFTPFLNGGLFEARETDLYKNSKLSFPKNYFDDLFDFLNGYNFTTDESTSQFQQVAIDPEMLGRIFENLLAEMTEETGEQARKAKGAFYTPREIVDYMCRESLREYLKTKIPEDQFRDQRFVQLIDAPDKDFQDQDHNWRRDWKPYKEEIIKALDELKVLDPACGSGAFPIGMLQLLVRVYERLEPRFDTYKAKLQIIEKNIYGVDIEPIAVEIARLRTWLSIIVDEESDSKKIKPLPNLEFKFVCANSLIDLDQNGTSAFGDDQELEDKLRNIRDAYFNTESIAKKRKLRIDYDKLVNITDSLFGESNKNKQLKTYRPFDNEVSASFFNSEFMFGIKLFDVVIGNPPYVFTREGDFGNNIKKNIQDRFLKNLAGSQIGRAKQSGKINFYAIFILQGLLLLKKGGLLSYIVPNTLLRATTYDVIRKYMLDNSKIINITDMSSGVFENVTASTTLLFIENNKSNLTHKILVQEGLPKDSDSGNQTFIPQESFNKNISYTFNIFSSDQTDMIVHKLIKSGSRLDNFVDILAGGIATGPGKKDYISNKKISDSYKPLIEGKDIKKYKLNFSDKFILYDRKKLYRARDESLFLRKEKLVTQRIGGGKFPLIVAYDNKQYYTFNSTNSIFLKKDSPISLKYILALLNSKLLNWFYTVQFTNKSTLTVNISKTFLEQLPIIVSASKNNIESLVDEILVLKDEDGKNNTSNIESKIDEIVMDLYGLTDEEKDLIRKSL
jgi:type I restriction-modification system DNA methylase subunit